MPCCRTLALLPLFMISVGAYAWSDTGHMVIAAIAERDLESQTRQEVARLLETSGSLGAPYWQAAVWADDHRTATSGPWHYINLHFRTDGKRTKMQPEKENVVVAIERFSSILADRTRSDIERTEALRYVLHFVGDCHQPLHAVARDTDRFPEGDRGGNEFTITPPAEFSWMERPPRNLHSLWDMGGGLFVFEQRPIAEAAIRRIRAQADTLRASLPEKTFRSAKNLNPMDWAKESLDASKKVVYRTDENSEPNGSYLANARSLCAKRAALAGYRLAKILNRCLGK